MACGPCMQQRRAFVESAQRFDVRGMATAVTRAAAINVDKMRRVDVVQKYGTPPTQGAVRATPYRRPPERS